MSTNTPPDPDYVADHTGVVIDTIITDQPLDSLLAVARRHVITPAMGAIVTFDGVVRDHDAGHRVRRLTYTAHPTAGQTLRDAAADIIRKHERVRIWVAHRVGALNIGDLAFVVMAAAAHRGDAFIAAADLADLVKATVPIWKEQELANGHMHWVGLE